MQYFPPVPLQPPAASTRRLPIDWRRRLVRGAALALASTIGVVAAGGVVEAAPGGSASASSLPRGIVGLLHGSTGSDVRALQEALVAAGIDLPGGPDGVFGPSTEEAVAEFQRREGLYIHGRVDQPTADALRAAVSTATGGGTAPAATTATSGESAPAATASAGGSTAAASAASGFVGLSVGARGAAVRRLQQRLTDVGVYVPGGIDGVYGSGTRTAVSNFQRWNGLKVTGTVTAAVVRALGLSSSSKGSTPPSSGRSNPLTGLKLGATGSRVTSLQRALMAAGIDVYGGADGLFGPATQRAVKAFQRAKGLRQTGVVDAATATKLSQVASTAPPRSSASSWVGLSLGARGTKVKQLQRALLDTGLTVRGGADGIFGPATKAALKAFQSVNGIPQTGVLTARGAQILGLTGSGGGERRGIVTPTGYPKFGEHSTRVQVMQRALMNAGIPLRGGADGKYGSATSGAIMEFQRRRGLPVTGVMNSTTARALGIRASAAPTPPSSSGISLRAFPVQGRCYFGDTWRAPRGGGRQHLGLDIIANSGNLVYAVVDGRISRKVVDQPGSLSGNGLQLQQPNGTYFSYYHLSRFARGMRPGVSVRAGQVIGYIGSTGNSATPHLHFEIHPGGGAAINPYPLVKAIDACHITAPRS